MSKQGFAPVLILLIMAGVLIIGGIYYYHIRFSITPSQVSSTTPSQNTFPASTSIAATITTSTPTSTLNKTSSYLVIKEWGVAFQKPSGMDDLVYVQPNIPISVDDKTANSVSFSTQRLINLDPSCTPETIPIGSLGRVSELSEFGDRGVPANVHIGNYYYFFITPQATCGPQAEQLETRQLHNLQDIILKTLKVGPSGQNSPTPSSTQPLTITGITITSPHGGERWMAGSGQTISWTATGVPANAFLVLSLVTKSGDESDVSDAGEIVAGLKYADVIKGSYRWGGYTMGADVGFVPKPGQYYVRAMLYDGPICGYGILSVCNYEQGKLVATYFTPAITIY